MLRPQEFRNVYDNGVRFSSALFSAFCLRGPEGGSARVGLTTPRALGNAVVRNRARRRVREAVRARLAKLSSSWSIVINPGRKILDCPYPDLEREIDRLILRCNA